jgi:4-hydroxybenzoyl-CoA thioesterase/acyl-CoA thioester hydrolase
MPAPYIATRRVEFRDTDAAGIMHFSAYFAHMEAAEHELLRSLGLSVVMRDEQGTISFPRVAASCDYSGAARFEELLDIEVRIERIGEKSVTYAFRFTRNDQEIAAGKMTSVCCRFDGHAAPPRSIPIPPQIADKLKTLADSDSIVV